jgi:hypothetical protein
MDATSWILKRFWWEGSFWVETPALMSANSEVFEVQIWKFVFARNRLLYKLSVREDVAVPRPRRRLGFMVRAGKKGG